MPFFVLMTPHPPSSSLFPYTTLFRSRFLLRPDGRRGARAGARPGATKRIRRRIRLVAPGRAPADRKSTRLNSSHSSTSYAVFCLKKKIITRLGLRAEGLKRDCLSNQSNTASNAFFCFNDAASTELFTLSLHDALPISVFTSA